MQDQFDKQVQLAYARVAGFVYLLLIVLFLGCEFLISGIIGPGDVAGMMERAHASQSAYRGALAVEVLTSIFTVVLAFALYVVVRPISERLAQLALYFRLWEAFVGAAAMLVSYVLFAIYTSGLDAVQAKTLLAIVHVVDRASFNITTLIFSFGSTIFFYLFVKSRYIPKLLAAFGVFASLVVTVASLSNLVLPEYARAMQIAFLPIFAAEIAAGFWLLLRGVRVH
jgi:Domain of unknown function (DUF4386)